MSGVKAVPEEVGVGDQRRTLQQAEDSISTVYLGEVIIIGIGKTSKKGKRAVNLTGKYT